MRMLLQEGMSKYFDDKYLNTARMYHGQQLKKQGESPDACAAVYVP